MRENETRQKAETSWKTRVRITEGENVREERKTKETEEG